MLCIIGSTHCAPAAERVGVYDSRLVAYADFQRPEHQEALKKLVAEGKAAMASGDAARHREIERQVKDAQQALHLQVFSTAPVPEAMARLREKLPAIAREAGVSRIVSKWDTDALKGVAESDRVDVTELLVRDYPLTDKQRETMKQIGTKEPMPLWKAKTLSWFKD